MKENIFYLFHVMRSSIPLNYVKKKTIRSENTTFPGYWLHNSLASKQICTFCNKTNEENGKRKEKNTLNFNFSIG